LTNVYSSCRCMQEKIPALPLNLLGFLGDFYNAVQYWHETWQDNSEVRFASVAK